MQWDGEVKEEQLAECNIHICGMTLTLVDWELFFSKLSCPKF